MAASPRLRVAGCWRRVPQKIWSTAAAAATGETARHDSCVNDGRLVPPAGRRCWGGENGRVRDGGLRPGDPPARVQHVGGGLPAGARQPPIIVAHGGPPPPRSTTFDGHGHVLGGRGLPPARYPHRKCLRGGPILDIGIRRKKPGVSAGAGPEIRGGGGLHGRCYLGGDPENLEGGSCKRRGRRVLGRGLKLRAGGADRTSPSWTVLPGMAAVSPPSLAKSRDWWAPAAKEPSHPSPPPTTPSVHQLAAATGSSRKMGPWGD